MKKKLGLIESKCLLYIGNGIAWLMFGAFSIFDNVICEIIASACLLFGMTSIVLGMSSKEKDDEMSKHNLIKAKATAMDLLKIIICLVLVINAVLGMLHIFFPTVKESISISLRPVIPMILGVTEIMIGWLFIKYERDGE